MNSTERHEARYQRRKAARRERELQRAAACGSFEEVFSFENLYAAGKECCKGVRWKASTQRFEAALVSITARLCDELNAGKFKSRGFIEFGLVERGKYRWIKSVHITERAIQKALNTHVLRPVFLPSLIYDNGACQKGKGTDFALDRLERHLHRHFRKYGRKGGIYLYDFSQYFDSIPHAVLVPAARRKIVNERLCAIYEQFVNAFGEVGLGLGSEISQISAVFFRNPFDHKIKSGEGMEGDAAFMDDGYIISDDIGKLKRLDAMLKALAAKLGVKFNEKKTRIARLTHSFKFLKMRFFLTETGAVVRRLSRENIVKRRRLLRKFRKRLDAGKMTLQSIIKSFTSWLGHASRAQSYKTVKSMKKLFISLFGKGTLKLCTQS